MTPNIKSGDTFPTQPVIVSSSNASIFAIIGCIILLIGLVSANYIYSYAKDRCEQQFEKEHRLLADVLAKYDSMEESVGRRNSFADYDLYTAAAERYRQASEDGIALLHSFKHAKNLATSVGVASVVTALFFWGMAARKIRSKSKRQSQ